MAARAAGPADSGASGETAATSRAWKQAMTRLTLASIRLAILVTLGAGAALFGSPSAEADDEASEHTAVLVGAAADTMGISVYFTEAAGWSMDLRTAPGQPTRTVALPFLDAGHAHYAVAVGPGREAFGFVMVSRARGVERDTVVAWVVAPDGTVLRSLAARQLHRGAALGLTGSVSHDDLTVGPVTLRGSRIELPLGRGREATLDLVRRALVR